MSDSVEIEEHSSVNLNFDALHIDSPRVKHSFATNKDESCQLLNLKPLKLLYTPKLSKIEINKESKINRQLIPHKEALLQLAKLRKEYHEKQERQNRLQRGLFEKQRGINKFQGNQS